MKLFLLDTLLREAPENGISKDSKRIYLLDAAEFSKTAEGMPHKKEGFADLSVVHYCKAELYGSCILGIIEVPLIKNENCLSPQKTLTERLHFGFFIENTALFLIGETEKLLPLIHRMKENHFSDSLTLPGFFCMLFNSFFENDVAFLQNLENKLASIEDSLTKDVPKDFRKHIFPLRKNLMHLDAYYDECISLCSAMRANTNGMLAKRIFCLMAICATARRVLQAASIICANMCCNYAKPIGNRSTNGKIRTPRFLPWFRRCFCRCRCLPAGMA